jgi:hypothetical protein
MKTGRPSCSRREKGSELLPTFHDLISLPCRSCGNTAGNTCLPLSSLKTQTFCTKKKKKESDLANDQARTAKRHENKGFVVTRQKKIEKITHRASSSTFSSFRHCSADKSMALALGTSNLRARKNLHHKIIPNATSKKKRPPDAWRKGGREKRVLRSFIQ